MIPATCERCGSKDVRVKRTRGLAHRAWQAVTGRQRYACNACHHRGWSTGRLPEAAPDAGRPTPPPGRPLEHRDLEAARQARTDRILAVAVALVLGALMAGFIAWAAS